MEIKQIRMGIVGAGTWGRTHASIYAEHLFADPVAICDMNEARAREIADEFGIRKVYTDYHDMAADEEIDAVAIVTPDFAHADIACAMADAGLGTINAVALTVEYIRNHGMDVKGIILNHYSGGAMQEDNEKMIERLTGVPVIARVRDGARELEVDLEVLKRVYD